MRMLASFRKNRRQITGFSLLELLVVLSLLGLLTAITFPNFVNLYQSVNSRLQTDQIIDDINGLGYAAFNSSTEIVLNNIPATRSNVWAEKRNAPVSLPVGWRLVVLNPIRYLQNGACQGGEIRLFFEGELIISKTLSPPFCRIKQS